MPWIEPPPAPCSHPERPTPRSSDNRRVWECPSCRQCWRVVVQDMGRDVMPGELPYQIFWRKVSR